MCVAVLDDEMRIVKLEVFYGERWLAVLCLCSNADTFLLY